MRYGLPLIATVLMVLIAALPMESHGERGGRAGVVRGGGRYYGAHRFYGGYRYGPRVYVGPGYYYPSYYYVPVPDPAYGVPAPAAYAAPDPAYGYIDPPAPDQGGYVSPPDNQGQVVTVPGQWIEGRWVPEHQVRVPPGQ